MALADAAFARMNRRCRAVFGDTVTRHNGAPEFAGELVEVDDESLEVRVALPAIRYSQAAAELFEGELVSVKGASYRISEPPRRLIDGDAIARLQSL